MNNNLQYSSYKTSSSELIRWVSWIGTLKGVLYLGDTYAAFLINLIKWGSKAITIIMY